MSTTMVMKGSIPARAGEPQFFHLNAFREQVYPHACGGTPVFPPERLPRAGLSPRVRGNRSETRRHRPLIGSIPARAGEPASPRSRPRIRRVYPRACGGTIRWPAPERVPSGLSPRVRGNRVGDCVVRPNFGSIPARAGEPAERAPRGSGPGVYPPRAGEPSTSTSLDMIVGVYPRACGGTRRFAC